MQGTASLVATTSAVTQPTTSLLDESLDTSTVSCETLAVFDSPSSDQLVLQSTPSHSSVETVDRVTHDMQVSSPSSPSISDISSISPLSLHSTPDDSVQHAMSDHVLPDTSASHSNSVFFKFVGDNLDKNVKPQDMRSDHQTESFHFFNTLAARIRGAQRIRRISYNGQDRVEGLVPVVEDWHAKVCFLKVLFCSNSSYSWSFIVTMHHTM